MARLRRVHEVRVLRPEMLRSESGCLRQWSEDDRGGDNLILSIHAYVIDLGGRRLLFDPGNGNDKERPLLTANAHFSKDFLQRLERAAG